MLDRLKLANAFDAMASYVEGIEASKTAAAHAERTAAVDKLASQYSNATGEELPDDIRNKLANSDKDIVALLQTVTEKQAARVEELGGPSARDDKSQPTSVKEAADQASDNFLNWITS